jgi:hypothetical protein
MADIDNIITRAEYEKRHEELSNIFNAQISRLDARIDKTETADSSLKTQMDLRFDKITDKIDTSEKLLSSQISTLKDDINRTRQSDLWRVIGWLVPAAFGGGGVFAILQAFHLLK